MRSPKHGLPWEALVLTVAAGAAVVFQLLLPSWLPTEADERAAAALLREQAHPGDVLLLHPWWTERFRAYAPTTLPVVGYLGSDGDPLDDFPRIWVLSEPHLPFTGSRAFADHFFPGRTRLAGPRSFGALELSLYANGRCTPALFRASDALEGAKVRLESPSGEVDCAPQPQGGFLCPNGVRVATEWHELFYAPHRCIVLEPPGGAARLWLEFPEVPATRSLKLEAGIIWEHAVRHDPGITPLVVGVVARGREQPLGVLRVAPGREGMQQVSLPGRAGPLRLFVQSDRRAERQTCIELRALDTEAPR